MGWIESKLVGIGLPTFAYVFVGSEALERLESSGEVIGIDEVEEMCLKLFAAVIEVPLDRSFLDGSVHSFDLAVGPGMVGFGEPVLDAMGAAHAIEGMATEPGGRALAVLGKIGELDAVVGEHDVDAIRDGF